MSGHLLPELYPQCGDGGVRAKAEGSREVERLARELARLVYEDKSTTVSERALFESTKRMYLKGIAKAWGFKKTDVVWNLPDKEMIEKMYMNIYQFSAAKNFHELKDLRDAMIDGERIREFADFEKQAKKIVGKYNRTWLRTEYNQAIAAGQASARWGEFMRNVEDMPYLQYQAIMDENTRDDHAKLHGIIKKAKDPFWNSCMPPNGWGCRCEVIQLPDGDYAETPSKNINMPNIPKMFRINFGKEGIAFPKRHAFFKRLPKDVETDVLARGRDEVRRIMHNAEVYEARYLNNAEYVDKEFCWYNGGTKATHVGHNFDKKKGHYEKNVQDVGFKNGDSVILEKEDHTIENKRNVEGLWNGKAFEIAASETATSNNIKKALNHCASKPNVAVAAVYFPFDNFDMEVAQNALARYRKLCKQGAKGIVDFEEIYFINETGILYKNSHPKE